MKTKNDDRITISKPIIPPTTGLSTKPTSTPTTNPNVNQSPSKFLGGSVSHSKLFSNQNQTKFKRPQNQATIMEAMGARYRKMVSAFNTNKGRLFYDVIRPGLVGCLRM